MASRLDDLIREYAERLDQLAGPIDLTDVTSAPGNDTTNVALMNIEPTWTQTSGRHRWPIIAVAAAAVVTVVGGLMIATRTDDPTGEVPADQPTTVAPTTVAPRRVVSAFEGYLPGVPVTYTVPDGWENIGNGVKKVDHPAKPVEGRWPSKFGVIFVNAKDNFYTHYCRSAAPKSGPVGPTVDDLVSAWTNLPEVDATAARDVTVDGFDAKEIELTVSADNGKDCSGMFYRCSSAQCSNELAGRTNQELKIWILDIDGERHMIVAGSFPDTSQHDRAALDEIVASIQIG